MRAGTLKHSAILQRPEKTLEANGEEVITWIDEISRRVFVQAKGGTEYEAAGVQVQADVTWEVWMRYDAETSRVTPEWQIRVADMNLEILSVENVRLRNRELKLVCMTYG